MEVLGNLKFRLGSALSQAQFSTECAIKYPIGRHMREHESADPLNIKHYNLNNFDSRK